MIKRLEYSYPISKDLAVDHSSLSIIPPPPPPPCKSISKEFSYIPQHLVTEILLRICAKSLLRFKSVCKSWYSLINDPDFIHRHFDCRTTATGRFNILSVTSYCYSKSKSKWWKSKCEDLGVRVSSCNGLICLFGIKFLYICNPTTQEILDLSRIRSRGGSCGGFGFDATTNQYKVVQLCTFRNRNALRGTIYTLGTSMKRPIINKDIPPFSYFRCKNSTFIHGSICWFVNDLGCRKSILCFDVGNERFRLIQVPKIYLRMEENDEYRHYSLVELEGKICFAEHNRAKEMLDIWMLKDYNVEEEEEEDMWIKIYRIPANNINDLPRSLMITPLWIRKKKNFFKLVSFDIESKQCELVFKPEDSCGTVVYKQGSLICLHDMMHGCPEYIRLELPDGWMERWKLN
ncbi:F-box domain [Macleaya cordata]|uniref:F-box domain n=1 Tax=Macleaya cordata TaxID=56857 RepID=A0A200QKZ8_MACCD|nr:F-box domain [Macleaya cordata]